MLEKTISAARSASDAKFWIIKDTAHPWKKKEHPGKLKVFTILYADLYYIIYVHVHYYKANYNVSQRLLILSIM